MTRSKSASALISIHALREEGDPASDLGPWPPDPISIHALREEGDAKFSLENTALFISIHALREEGDQGRQQKGLRVADFYPRPPRGGRPSLGSAQRSSPFDFYPRPPRGGRQPPARKRAPQKKFLSTPSARRATDIQACTDSRHNNFYPRPPRGGRQVWHGRQRKERNFYPRPPRGGRHEGVGQKCAAALISIHALREEGDRRKSGSLSAEQAISIHALREEGDTFSERLVALRKEFLSTPSARRATFNGRR